MLLTQSTCFGAKALLRLGHLSALFIYSRRCDVSLLSAPRKVTQAHLTARAEILQFNLLPPQIMPALQFYRSSIHLKRKGQITVMETIQWRLPGEILHPQGEKGSLRSERRKHLYCKSNQLEAGREALWSLPSPVQFNQLQQLVTLKDRPFSYLTQIPQTQKSTSAYEQKWSVAKVPQSSPPALNPSKKKKKPLNSCMCLLFSSHLHLDDF